MTDIIKFKVGNKEIFGAYKEDYEYDKEDFLKWLAERNDCSVDDITTTEVSIDEESDNIEMFFCEYCDRLEFYELTDEELEDLNNYAYYGNPERKLIQDVVPNMPGWCRETYIGNNIGCICPTCLKITRSDEI